MSYKLFENSPEKRWKKDFRTEIKIYELISDNKQSINHDSIKNVQNKISFTTT